MWNVCSKMVYMILPMPKEGSMTLGITSSTAGDKRGKKPELHHFPTPSRGVLCGVELTVQSLLESVHTYHVLGELEGLAVCLDGELSINEESPVGYAKKPQYPQSPL